MLNNTTASHIHSQVAQMNGYEKSAAGTTTISQQQHQSKISLQNTFSKQLEFTRRFPGLISRCKIQAEWRYFKPVVHHNHNHLSHHSYSQPCIILHMITSYIRSKCNYSVQLEAVWFSSYGGRYINEVTLSPTQSVYSWVTVHRHTVDVCNQPPRPTQPSTLVGWEMSTKQSAIMLYRWEVKTGWLIPFVDLNVMGNRYHNWAP